jgi:sulfite exporter TauE/SafE
MQPFLRRLLPIRTLPGAFAVGAVWGWLPCGLVYSVLVSALASGSARQGGLLMLAFGLGTLPNLLAMGLFAQQLRSILQQRWMRRTAGLLVMGFGVLGLIRLYG